MHTVLLRFILLTTDSFDVFHVFIYFEIDTLALGQSHDRSDAIRVIRKDINKSTGIKNHKPRMYFMGSVNRGQELLLGITQRSFKTFRQWYSV